MKITQFNQNSVEILSKNIQLAMDYLAEKHGLEMQISGECWLDGEFRCKIEAKIPGSETRAEKYLGLSKSMMNSFAE